MSDISNVINEAIDEVININEMDKLEVMKGHWGNKLYNKLHPEENQPDTKFEAVKTLSKALGKERAAHALTKKESDSQHSVEHAVDNTKKFFKGATASGKKFVDEVKSGERNLQNVPGNIKSLAKKGAAAVKEAASDVGNKTSKLAGEAQEKALDAKGHIVAAGKKALSSADDAIKEHPYLTAAAAAALAAGAGGLAAVKRMRKASKK